MSQISKIDPGRVDHLALGIFDQLLKRHANPEIRLACKLLEDEIVECFEETFGPGTKAHEVGRRLLKLTGGNR